MKFSIIIPTQNRPNLIALAVYYVLNQNYKNIELIVSDNSTTIEAKEQNRIKLESYIQENKLRLVGPSKVLSITEHFEYALQHATGDYILFLTDKMILLPDTLDSVSKSIRNTGAEIVNWTYHYFITDDYLNPAQSGHFFMNFSHSSGINYEEYDPLKQLIFKASGVLSRQNQNREDYVKGKICFGCYSKDLISRIIDKTGALYGGVTHDYSAMAQALCLASKSIILKIPGIIFISIPVDKSLGSLTYFQSSAALKYYKSFPDFESKLRSLFVPGLYASQHNMVAHDYIKYLMIYSKRDLFIDKFWIYSIGEDLYLSNKVWESDQEKKSQMDLFFYYLDRNINLKIYFYYKRYKKKYANFEKIFLKIKLFAKKIIFLMKRVIIFTCPYGKLLINKNKSNQLSYQSLSLNEAVHMVNDYFLEKNKKI